MGLCMACGKWGQVLLGEDSGSEKSLESGPIQQGLGVEAGHLGLGGTGVRVGDGLWLLSSAQAEAGAGIIRTGMWAVAAG